MTTLKRISIGLALAALTSTAALASDASADRAALREGKATASATVKPSGPAEPGNPCGDCCKRAR